MDNRHRGAGCVVGLLLVALSGCRLWVDDELQAENAKTCVWYPDIDGDGFGDSTVEAVFRCKAPKGSWVHVGGDCNDGDAHRYPDAPERCDGVPNDCALQLPSPYEVDTDGDGYVKCSWLAETWRGSSLIVGGEDCAPRDARIRPGLQESCDNLDNDCDGEVDEDVVYTDYFEDADRDGFGDPNARVYRACLDPNDGRVPNDLDCDDAIASVHPGATERCDGLDDNCDGILPAGESDIDGDGYVGCMADPDGWLAGVEPSYGDCDDERFQIHPNAAEQCDGLDNNCDGSYGPGELDQDGDGVVPCSVAPTGWLGPQAPKFEDCDDANAMKYPGALERCDGQDNDCNGEVPSEEQDRDGDLYVVCKLDVPVWSGVSGGRDCDDQDITRHPGAPELCDGLDNNCDQILPPGEVDDDGDYTVECARAADGWYGDGDIVGWEDCDDLDARRFVGAPELCDGLDNNCDGQIPSDEQDQDVGGGDLYVRCEIDAGGWRGARGILGGGDCDPTDSTVYPGAADRCDGKDNGCTGGLTNDELDSDGDRYVECAITAPWVGVVGGEDCDDGRASVFPTAPELCDGLDNNCDGVLPIDETDDDVPAGDGFVECAFSFATWVGDPGVIGGGDCNDTDQRINPGAAELCDGFDNDCDFLTDMSDPDVTDWQLVYPDTDGDGYGNELFQPREGCDDENHASNNLDCNDSDATLNPDTRWYLDADADGFGDPTIWISQCLPPAGYLRDNTDCDDADVGENPDVSWYSDTDGDGYGNPDVASTPCERADPTDVPNGTDCDDSDPTFNPAVDWYADSDRDGFGDAGTVSNCAPADPSDLLDATDCDDANGWVFPGAAEVCANAVDDDCDQDTDEYCAGENYFTQVSAGFKAICAVDLAHRIQCWGSGSWGENVPPPEADFQQVSVGASNACGLRMDGSIDCWGDPRYLGDKSGVFTVVDVGHRAACALRDSGAVYCWGRESASSAGPFTAVSITDDKGYIALREDGSILHNIGSHAVPTAGPYSAVAAGSLGSCALDLNGQMVCAPNQVATSGSFVQMECNNWGWCALRADGDAQCGETVVSSPSPFVQVTVGSAGQCGVRADGVVDCWSGPQPPAAIDLPPPAPSISLTPGNPMAGTDDLLCQLDVPLNADYLELSWGVDGEVADPAVIATTVEPGDTILGASTISGQAWTCRGLAQNGANWGEAAYMTVIIP